MDYTSELKKLHELKEKNIISEDEYNDQKESILSKIKGGEKKQQEVSTSTLTADPNAKSKREKLMEYETTQYKPVSIGDWIITYLIMMIPLINIIMLFVWGLGSNTQPSKANWAKATLIWFVIAFVIAIVISVVFGAAIAIIASEHPDF